MDALKMPGLSTGLDTTSIIQQLMAVERRPVNLLQQSQATTQSRLDAYRAINTKLLALQNSAKTLMGVSQNLSPFSTNSATSSNTAAFTATASSTASPGTYNVNITQLAQAQTRGGNAFNAAHGAGTLRIAGPAGTANIAITAGESAQAIADAINADANSGMNATVAGGRLLLSGKKTGAAETYTISMAAGPATLTQLGLQVNAATDKAALDAKATVNGVAITSGTNTFANALSGVDITATALGAGTVTIAKDSTAAVNDIKDLVAKFNDVVNAIKDYTKYDPNTKKGGVLAGDAFIGDLQAKLTSMVTGTFDGRAYAGGATPGLRNYTDVGLSIQRDGTLTLDETKLKSAMNTYSQQTASSGSVYQLFANEDGAMSGSTKLNNFGTAAAFGDGIANRLAAFADQMISPSSLYNSPSGTGRYNGALNERINGFTTQIKDYGDKIAAYNLRLDQYQTFLQNQFTNMEKVVAQLRSQGSYLAGQTGSSAG
jgi:flagellar hook-associated protein 2